MSEEQLTVLLAKLKEDVGLREKLKGAEDLNAALAIARNAGFEVSEEELITIDGFANLLTDAELERPAGGVHTVPELGCGTRYGCVATTAPCPKTKNQLDGNCAGGVVA